MSNTCRLDSLLTPKPTEDAFIDWMVQPLVDAVAQIKRKHTPDPKRVVRHLPVITAIVYTDDIGRQSVIGVAVDEPEVSGILRANRAPIEEGLAVASRYEPAVPKCGTCGSFRIREYGDGFGEPAYCDGPFNGDVPADGSGYCHEHPDAKGNHG